ncbi:GTP-binding protein [Lyngbya confervoides]|uniref:GTP-binding protein n=1 Tax=Lyngbya confervoides TaxID=207921 RepID=UPI00140E6E42
MLEIADGRSAAAPRRCGGGVPGVRCLGSGKTTFIHQILGRVVDLRMAAMLMNELDQIDLDGQLLRSQDKTARAFSRFRKKMKCGFWRDDYFWKIYSSGRTTRHVIFF